MAKRTYRETSNEKLIRLKTKLESETLKVKPDPSLVAGYLASISEIEKRLASEDPKLDQIDPSTSWDWVG